MSKPKFNPERPTMLMVVEKADRGIRLRPADPHSEEALNEFPYGTELNIKCYQQRSHGRLSLYWWVLAKCVDNGDNKYGNAENLHDVLKITLGYCRRVKAIGVGPAAKLLDEGIVLLRAGWRVASIIKKAVHGVVDVTPLMACLEKVAIKLNKLKEIVGDTIVLPGSISFAKMSESEMKVYFDKAMLQLETAGYPITDLLKEADRLSKKNYFPAPNGESNGPSQSQSRRDRGAEEHAEATAEAA